MGLSQKEKKAFLRDKKIRDENSYQVVRGNKKQMEYVKLTIINCLKITSFQFLSVQLFLLR